VVERAKGPLLDIAKSREQVPTSSCVAWWFAETINRNVYILGKDQPTRVNARREGREHQPAITRKSLRGKRASKEEGEEYIGREVAVLENP
jgi:hypothetical protein